MMMVVKFAFVTAILPMMQSSVILGVTASYSTSGPRSSHCHQHTIRGWKSVDEFPPPVDGMSDPDHILSEMASQNIRRILQCSQLTIPIRMISNNKNDAGTTTTDSEKSDDEDSVFDVPVQMAVAIVEHLDIGPVESGYHDVDEIVENFAMRLHSKWGVGHPTSQGGTGILIFLDVCDRVVYISVGTAVRALNNPRVNHVIHEMKPALKQAKYELGLALAIELITELIEKGEPTFWERFLDLFRLENLLVCFHLFVVGSSIFQGWWKKYREQREYVLIASQLTNLDRAQALALQGNYQAQTSCPICLECFASTTKGSDELSIKLLRCGHVFDESCWSEWVSSGRGDVMKCPVCRMDVGPRPSKATLSNLQPVPTHDNDHSTGSNTVGNNVNEPSAAPTATQVVDDSPGIDDDPQQPEHDTLMDSDPDNNINSIVNNVEDPDRNRALRLFQQERNFRLMRLANLYPRYVTTNQVMRWTSPTRNGLMTRDPSFAQTDQATNLRHHLSAGSRCMGRAGNGGGSGSGGFGGGKSGGGRSGRF